ncbi:class I SAM-dependent methyltransferase [Mycobacterium shigaense]|uniref:O-methyltransferase n=1 Tax=Mycobacterium shigaense TaxID=722731 RepID=A0A1Z4EM36_9MYCO|nr:class I SAM-dependent methyltransferase [Mycobacterium shigaense]PRI14699.1 methyltransferase [Mycobacterium shigaense]BAX93980.1 O-methyltransferase [Mycobacterium shigaense]
MTSTDGPAKEAVSLSGVSETALLTLNARAQEARRPDSVIDDPMAIALADSIDVDFAKFGTAHQGMAMRARVFDSRTLTYLDEHPAATVVALAEGLQTSFWRIDAARPEGRFRWLTVDLPPIIEVRTRLLPASPRVRLCAQSALDYSWMDAVDASNGVFITAEGLLMYLQPEQALGLIAQCAKRFPGGQMMFDLPPGWFSKLTRCGAMRTTRRYRVPPMPFSLSVRQAAGLVRTPGVRAARDVRPLAGRGSLFNAAAAFIYRAPLLEPLRPTVTLLEFG